jgi:hypothetical protein
MSSSRSSSKTDANQTQTTQTKNLNLQDTEGVTLADISGSVSLTQTDFGAVEGGIEVSRAALDLGRDSLGIGADPAGRGLDRAYEFSGDTAKIAYDFSSDTNKQAYDFAGGALSAVTDFADSTRMETSSLFKQSLGSIADLAMQTSASTDDRVAKVATYAVLAVVAAMVLPAIFRG